jgi:hypothetical protein
MHFGSNNFANRFWAQNHYGRALAREIRWESHFGSNHFASNHHLSFHWERESESPLGFVSVLHLTGILGAGGDPTPLFGYRNFMELCGAVVSGGAPRKPGRLNVPLVGDRARILRLALEEDEEFMLLLPEMLGLR